VTADGSCGGGLSGFQPAGDLPYLATVLLPHLLLAPVGALACRAAWRRGRSAFDYGDTAKLTPMVKAHTPGHGFLPPPSHAGGLRYDGAVPILSALVDAGVIGAQAMAQADVFAAARLFAHTEGIIRAPAIAAPLRGLLEQPAASGAAS